MSADDRAPTIKEELVPAWAGDVYFAVGLIAATVFLGLDLFTGTMPGMAVLKALGIVMLAAYALFRGAPFVALALGLSACGDFMLELGPEGLRLGIGFFAAAHVTYLAILIVRIIKGGWRRDGLVLAAALFAFGAAMWVWLRPGMGALETEATGYLAIILIMAMAAGLAPGPRLIVAGALLFVVSDSILAARWFQDAFIFPGALDWGGAMVWITYVAAQACLARGLAEKPNAAA